MGWLFCSESIDSLVRELTAPGEFADGKRTVLAHALTRDCNGQLVLWTAVKLEAKTDAFSPLKAGESCVFIGCDLIDCSGGKYGYKGLDETAEPYYYACPRRILDLATAPSNATAAKWRADVLKYHQAHRVTELQLDAALAT